MIWDTLQACCPKNRAVLPKITGMVLDLPYHEIGEILWDNATRDRVTEEALQLLEESRIELRMLQALEPSDAVDAREQDRASWRSSSSPSLGPKTKGNVSEDCVRRVLDPERNSNQLLSVGEAEEDTNHNHQGSRVLTPQEWVERVFGPPSPPGWRDESPEGSEEAAPVVAFRNVFNGVARESSPPAWGGDTTEAAMDLGFVQTRTSPDWSMETQAGVSAKGFRKNKQGDARSKYRAAPYEYRVTGQGSGSGENFTSSERPLSGQQGYPHEALKGNMGQGTITESAGSNQLSRVGCAQGPRRVDPVAREVPPSLESMPPEFQREVAYYDELQRRQDFEEFGVVFTTGSEVHGRSHDQESGQTQAISAESRPSLQGLRLRVPRSASQCVRLQGERRESTLGGV